MNCAWLEEEGRWLNLYGKFLLFHTSQVQDLLKGGRLL